MARRVTKCLVGLQNHSPNPDWRNTFQAHLWYWKSNTYWSINHQHKKRILSRRQQWRSAEGQPGLLGWDKRGSLQKNDKVLVKDDWVLQQKSKAQKTKHRRSCFTQNHTSNKGLSTRKVRTNLGRTLIVHYSRQGSSWNWWTGRDCYDHGTSSIWRGIIIRDKPLL